MGPFVVVSRSESASSRFVMSRLRRTIASPSDFMVGARVAKPGDVEEVRGGPEGLHPMIVRQRVAVLFVAP